MAQRSFLAAAVGVDTPPTFGVDTLNDVYTLTVSGTSAAWASLSSDGDTPSARYCHSMTALGDGRAVLFGGGGSHGGYFNDVYTLTVSGTSANVGVAEQRW